MAVILILEDEQLLRWSLVRRLEGLGHTVLQAETIGEASEHLRNALPDLVLLDLSLPDGHGLDFLERNRGRLQGSTVLVMTAVGDSADAARAAGLGALEFLTKPVAHEALVRVVAFHLERRPAHADG
jgi:DNA-binding response OmpR family regulator